MRLKPRLEALERRLAPKPAKRWVRVIQGEGQTYEQACAAHEAEHGPLGDANVILRVIVQTPRINGVGSRISCAGR